MRRKGNDALSWNRLGESVKSFGLVLRRDGFGATKQVVIGQVLGQSLSSRLPCAELRLQWSFQCPATCQLGTDPETPPVYRPCSLDAVEWFPVQVRFAARDPINLDLGKLAIIVLNFAFYSLPNNEWSFLHGESPRQSVYTIDWIAV
jgi:hypothetical protein